MGETHYFYDPEVLGQLPADEARHAVRVLRLGAGERVRLVDGRGWAYDAELTDTGGGRCAYTIVETTEQPKAWLGHLHLAVAPTKLGDRVDWLVEKATELGIDEFTFLACHFSERRRVNTDRLERILVSAMKQSHKARKPRLNGIEDFAAFVERERAGGKYICHCHEGDKPHLLDALTRGEDATVLVGPEGDFDGKEVELALRRGYTAVGLGHSRLRTETAAIAATHIMQIRNMT